MHSTIEIPTDTSESKVAERVPRRSSCRSNTLVLGLLTSWSIVMLLAPLFDGGSKVRFWEEGIDKTTQILRGLMFFWMFIAMPTALGEVLSFKPLKDLNDHDWRLPTDQEIIDVKKKKCPKDFEIRTLAVNPDQTVTFERKIRSVENKQFGHIVTSITFGSETIHQHLLQTLSFFKHLKPMRKHILKLKDFLEPRRPISAGNIKNTSTLILEDISK